jgi:hypothetical protein
MVFSKLMAKRSPLRARNNTVTKAAELSLRESLWPLMIVTILFFLWVSLEETIHQWRIVFGNAIEQSSNRAIERSS